MTDSLTAAAVTIESDRELASILPIAPIIPSNSDVVKTLPFDTSEKSEDLRITSLEHTKQRWAWFLKTKDQHREYDTQLDILEYLPQEVRWKMFKNVFVR